MKIRTVKPELYRHRELYDLERETQLPIRFAWTGLFGVCDREGRFKWEPEVLKLDVLPFDDLDFSWVLDALAARGFIIKYRVKPAEGQSTCTHVQARAEKWFGFIPSFLRHQRPNQREAKSSLPAPDENTEAAAVEFPTIPVRTCTHVQARGEVEVEVEGKGSGSGNGTLAPGVRKRRAPRGVTVPTWEAYSRAYKHRYGEAPIRNPTVGGQLSNFVTRVGAEEAPLVAEFYLSHNDAWYVKQMHSVGAMVRDAEKLRTEWATGRRVLSSQAREVERRQHNADAFARAEEMLKRGVGHGA